MPAIKPTREIAEKWRRVVPGRTEDYRRGVEDPKVDWETATKAAEDRYRTGVTEAAAQGRFGAGVAKAGTAKWKDRATKLGPRRWSEGVGIAAPDYERGFGPYRDVIERTVLPEKFPKGDPRNYERVLAMGTALHELKVRGG